MGVVSAEALTTVNVTVKTKLYIDKKKGKGRFKYLEIQLNNSIDFKLPSEGGGADFRGRTKK